MSEQNTPKEPTKPGLLLPERRAMTQTRPENYLLPDPLREAVKLALTLDQPLLLTGEPGTGKTLLAYKVAYDLSQNSSEEEDKAPRFLSEPLRFNTKTTSTARDLFYTYDAISHFQEANLKREDGSRRQTRDFIELQALGKAIAMAQPLKEQKGFAHRFQWENPTAPMSSVVLIDEIDKAPRDFTNDLLNEIENKEFSIKEQGNFRVTFDPLDDNGQPQRGKNPQRMLVIMTSNSEKNLPDPFLRRCIFYHIEFPGPEALMEILKAQLDQQKDQPSNGSEPGKSTDENIRKMVDLFLDLREKTVRKKPATAELVSLLKVLEMNELLDQENADVREWYRSNLSLLVKTREDIQALQAFLELEPDRS